MRKRSRRRTRAGIIGCGLLLAGLAIGLWLAWPRERLLMQEAHAVPSIHADSQWWDWLSDEELLLVTTDRRRDDSTGAHWLGHADVVNARTGQRTPQTGLSAMWKREGISIPRSFHLSLDGVWLVWCGHPAGNWPFPAASHRDGTHYRGWTDEDKWTEDYFLDNRHWVETGLHSDTMRVFDLAEPSKDRKMAAQSVQAKAVAAQYAARKQRFIEVDDLDGGGPFRLRTYRTEDSLQKTQAELRLSHRAAPIPIETRMVNLPPGATLVRAGESPQLRAIYYQLQFRRTNPALGLLHRILPNIHDKPSWTEGLWVSRMDGSGLREIGHISIPEPEFGSFELMGVEWLPGGRQISFRYQDRLYVVSAEPGR